jgi:hypothetical protein
MSGHRKWTKSTYSMMIGARDNKPEKMLVAGIMDGTFGLDRRKCWNFGSRRTGYVITHLATGFSVRHLACNLKQAKDAVALLHGADWNFSDPNEAAKSEARMATVHAVNRTGFAVDSSEFDPAVEATS